MSHAVFADHKARGPVIGVTLALMVVSGTAVAVPKDLAYPTRAPTAQQVADQVYFVNRFYAISNVEV